MRRSSTAAPAASRWAEGVAKGKQRVAIVGAALSDGGRVDDKSAFHHHDANIELLRRSIISWHGEGFCELATHPHDRDGQCRPRPITPANLELLDDTGESLMAEIRKRQVTESVFLGGTPNTSTATASRPDSAPSPSTTPADTRPAPDADAISATSPSGSTASS